MATGAGVALAVGAPAAGGWGLDDAGCGAGGICGGLSGSHPPEAAAKQAAVTVRRTSTRPASLATFALAPPIEHMRHD